MAKVTNSDLKNASPKAPSQTKGRNATGSQPPDADPDVPYRYFLEIDGVDCVRFNKLSGLKMSTSVSHVREGGNNHYEHAFIDGQTFEPLTIEKAFYSAKDEFFKWMRRVHNPTQKFDRTTISVVMLDDKANEVGRWNIKGAFITEYEGPSFDSQSKEIAIEKMKIQYDWFEYVKGGQ